MTETRINFLDWKPDLEDLANDGLSVADNVIHEPDGYKPAHLGSAGNFSTTGGLAASVGTILSIVCKPIGSQDDLLCAWITDGATPELNIGVNGQTMTSNTTGYPLSFATLGTSQEIYAFDVCEAADRVFFVVEARQSNSGGESTLTHAGYLDDTIF